MYKIKLCAVAMGALLAFPVGAADEPSALPKEVKLEVKPEAKSELGSGNGIEVGGWVNAGMTYNTNKPANGFNGPVTFADRSKELQLNQFNVFVQRAVATEGKGWDFGGRLDVMFGTDAIFTQAYGIPARDVNTGQASARSKWDLNLCCSSSRFYNAALPQMYVEGYAPVGNGLNLKLGHFYSPTGYETVPAPDNFFYTKAYTFTNGEPFTHTGLLGNYVVNKNWALMGAAITGSATGGWDGGLDKQLNNWGGLAGGTWTSDDKISSVNLTGSYSNTSAQSNQPWKFYSLVIQHKVTPKTLLVLHQTTGFAGGVLLYDNSHKDAMWYGIDMQVHHDIRDNLSVGVRAERFHDRDGFRVCSPIRVSQATDGAGVNFAASFPATCRPADYYDVTLGINWKPTKELKTDWKAMQSLNIRPNIRYDRVDGIGQAYNPFDSKRDQLLLSVDAMISF